jgi:hypothetical protein
MQELLAQRWGEEHLPRPHRAEKGPAFSKVGLELPTHSPISLYLVPREVGLIIPILWIKKLRHTVLLLSQGHRGKNLQCMEFIQFLLVLQTSGVLHLALFSVH